MSDIKKDKKIDTLDRDSVEKIFKKVVDCYEVEEGMYKRELILQDEQIDDFKNQILSLIPKQETYNEDKVREILHPFQMCEEQKTTLKKDDIIVEADEVEPLIWDLSQLALPGKSMGSYKDFAVKYHQDNFGEEDQENRLLFGIGEELGELYHAHLKGLQNIRHTPEEILHKKKDAIGDLMVYLLNYCHTQNFDIFECLEMAKKELEKRSVICKGDKDGKI